MFPNYPRMTVDKNWLMGVWVLGNMYKKQSDYYGAYPGNYLKRLYSLCPDRVKTLHLFSGTVQASPGEVTVDCNPELNPTVVADARHLPFTTDAFDTVIAYPPYSAKDAVNYGTPMIARGPVVKHIRSVTKKGGLLFWLDTVRPMYSKLNWKQVGAVAVLVSTNTRVRCLSMFEAV
jgi:hypothetical protein